MSLGHHGSRFLAFLMLTTGSQVYATPAHRRHLEEHINYRDPSLVEEPQLMRYDSSVETHNDSHSIRRTEPLTGSLVEDQQQGVLHSSEEKDADRSDYSVRRTEPRMGSEDDEEQPRDSTIAENGDASRNDYSVRRTGSFREDEDEQEPQDSSSVENGGGRNSYGVLDTERRTGSFTEGDKEVQRDSSIVENEGSRNDYGVLDTERRAGSFTEEERDSSVVENIQGQHDSVRRTEPRTGSFTDEEQQRNYQPPQAYGSLSSERSADGNVRTSIETFSEEQGEEQSSTTGDSALASNDDDSVDAKPPLMGIPNDEQATSSLRTATTNGTPSYASFETETTPLQRSDPSSSEQSYDETLPFDAVTRTACQTIDTALAFMTTLDFQQTLTGAGTTPDFYTAVYLLQMAVTPLSIGLLLCGARLFLHTCVLCASSLGLFTIFGLIDVLLPIRSPVECHIKLGLSLVAAICSGVLASVFFRFALFCFGTVTVGGGAYVLLDNFSFLDPGAMVYNAIDTIFMGSGGGSVEPMLPVIESDLSLVAWCIITIVGLCGGMLLRYYEKATLELVTASMGGVGCAYSLHTMALVNGITLPPMIILVLAFMFFVGGWRFQSRRRAKDYHANKRRQEQLPTTVKGNDKDLYASQLQLQSQLDGLREGLLPKDGSPNSSQISELTSSINRFMEIMEAKQKHKSDKES